MRVALLIHGWPPAAMGGTGLYVAALGAALARAGHAVAIVAPGLGKKAEMAAVDSPVPGVEGFSLRGPAPRRWEQTWAPLTLSAWTAWTQAWKPDIVHAHHLSGLPWAAVRDTDLATVLTLHDYAIPCARGQLINAAGALCPGPERTRCATCLADQLELNPLRYGVGRLLSPFPRLRLAARERMAAPGRKQPSRSALARCDLRAAAAAELLAGVDVLLSPSGDLADRIASFGLRRPDLCDLPLLSPIAAALEPGQGPVRFLFASAILPSKGPDWLLDAFSALPAGAATLTLAGPSPAVDARPDFAGLLARRAARTPGVRWLGHLPQAEISALLGAHDVLVLPSRWPENSPLIVREASAAGLRVIASSLGGAREIEPRARLVRPDREDDLLQALRAECETGRARSTARAWPDPDRHALELARTVYAAAISRRASGRSHSAPKPGAALARSGSVQ